MNEGRDYKEPFSVLVVSSVLFCLFTAFAVVAVVTHCCQIVGLSFSAYVYILVVLTTIAIAFTGRLCLVCFEPPPERDTSVLAALLLIGCIGATLALAVHRPNLDDMFYVPNAVYYVQHPGAPMGFKIHFLDGAGQPLESSAWATSLAFEYGQAALAYILHTEFLTVYYLITPALIGFIIPMCFFLLLACFCDRSEDAAWGTAFTMAVLLLLGETAWVHGSLAFPRAFQSKALLLTCGIPLFAAVTISFLKRPSRRGWLFLFVIATGLTGTGLSALLLLCCLALVLAAAHYVVTEQERRSILLPARYLCCLAYALLYGGMVVWLNHRAHLDLGQHSPANQGWPTSFFGHLRFLYDPARPVTLLVCFIASILAIYLTQGWSRRFLMAWMVIVVLAFLNPLAGNSLISTIIGPNVYWRMFYLFPFPLVVGISFARLIRLLAPMSRVQRNTVLAGCLLTLLALHIPRNSTSIFRFNTSVRWPSYKLLPDQLALARQIVAVTPPGAMLAPKGIGGIIPMLRSGYPQMALRERETRALWTSRPDRQVAETRIRATAYVGDESREMARQLGRPAFILPQSPELDRVREAAFAQVIAYPELRSIVMDKTIFQRKSVQRLLKTQRFTEYRVYDPIVVAWR